MEPGNEYKAYAIGINQTGELIVERRMGKKKKSMPERYQLEEYMDMYNKEK